MMERLETGVPGLDEVLGGGIPVGSMLLVAGPPGAGKTVMTEQIAFTQAARGKRSLILTTLSEPHDKLIRFCSAFPWFDGARIGHEREVEYLSLYVAAREEGLHAALELVVRTVRERRCELLVVDSFRSLRDLAGEGSGEDSLRRFLFDLGGTLGLLGVTCLLAGEYAREDRSVYPEFTIVDGIVYLANELLGVRHARTLEVLKLRGSAFLDGRHSLVLDGGGARIYPRHAVAARHTPYELNAERVSTGVPALDEILDGGLRGNSTTVVLGPTGTGKTTLALHFLAEGARRGEPGLMVSFDENAEHLNDKVLRLGLLDRPLFDDELVRLHWRPAVEADVDEVTAQIRESTEALGARRFVLDGAGVLELVLNGVRLNDYVLSLVNYLRSRNVASLICRETPSVADGAMQFGAQAGAAIADNTLLLRHVELEGQLQRVLAVVNTRDSAFDPSVRRFTVETGGLKVGEPLRGVAGTFAGVAPRLEPRGQ